MNEYERRVHRARGLIRQAIDECEGLLAASSPLCIGCRFIVAFVRTSLRLAVSDLEHVNVYPHGGPASEVPPAERPS